MNTKSAIISTLALGALPQVLLAGPAEMIPAPTPAPSNSGDWCEWLKTDPGTIYKNPDNTFLQKLVFTGRFQYDYAHVDGDGRPKGAANGGDVDLDAVDLRRLRAGFKATLFGNLTAHVEGEFDYNEDPTYQRLTDAYLAWKFSDALSLKVGKQSMPFTLDGSTSSKELLTIDRSNLTNNLWFTNEYLPGVTLSGKSGNWVYNAGVFSQGEEDGEFGNFDAGTSWLASFGYDFSKQLGADEALLMVDYVFNEETPAGTGLFTNRSLHQVFSVNFSYEKGDFGFRGDASAGQGFLGQSDIFGITAMPYYNFTDKLQGVFRYTYLESRGNNGLRLARYESQALNSGRGDRYNELYAGLNYYMCGHKLKLQSGLQYSWMNDDANDGGDFEGLSWITGFRLSW